MRAQIFNRNLLLILVILCGVLFFSPAYAEESPSSTEDIVEETSTTTEDIAEDEGTTPTTTEEIIEELIYTNQVSVNYIGEEIFNGEVITTSTWFLDSNDTLYSNTSTITALGVLMQASRQENFSVNVENLGWGYYVSSVDENASEGYDGWIYNVNNTDPGWAGINDYTMNDGDSLQVFYNVWPWKIGSDVTSTYENKPVTFTAYKYADSTWGPSPSTTISVNNELFETDNTGQYIYTTSTTGTLQAYIYGSADWPTNSPSISVEILEAATTTATSTDDNTDDGDDSGSSGSTPPTMTNESISQDELNAATEKILNYLKSQQDETGKILDGNMTDWAIMSFGADEQYADDIKQTDGESLLEYEKSYSLDADSDLNDCASFPRHVLA